MSVMSQLHMDISDAIVNGDSFYEIAAKYHVSLETVEAIADEIDGEAEYDYCDDGDDGYALASAGFGSDEDYVHDNDYFDDF